MARPKGSKAKHARDKSLGLVRLTDSEKRQIAKNAAVADLSVAGFVRARILPEVSPDEVLSDPIPGGRLTVKRSQLTSAIQRIGVNLRQLETILNEIGDIDLQDRLAEVRDQYRAAQSDHLASGAEAIEARSGWTDELNNLGRDLNRFTRGANARGHIAKPDSFRALLDAIGHTMEAFVEGQGAPEG